jgi:hypothetical protein
VLLVVWVTERWTSKVTLARGGGLTSVLSGGRESPLPRVVIDRMSLSPSSSLVRRPPGLYACTEGSLGRFSRSGEGIPAPSLSSDTALRERRRWPMSDRTGPLRLDALDEVDREEALDEGALVELPLTTCILTALSSGTVHVISERRTSQ